MCWGCTCYGLKLLKADRAGTPGDAGPVGSHPGPGGAGCAGREGNICGLITTWFTPVG